MRKNRTRNSFLGTEHSVKQNSAESSKHLLTCICFKYKSLFFYVTTRQKGLKCRSQEAERWVQKNSQLYFQEVRFGTQAVNQRRQTQQGKAERAKGLNTGKTHTHWELKAGTPDTRVLRWTGKHKELHKDYGHFSNSRILSYYGSLKFKYGPKPHMP